ncbi:unnamed protein product [Polarella glacialis]|uniref:Uncharacterized protein n=1 Tax=Polarella glacialis TaxID=89957 RepID=A0A813LRY8_POLGL|nr:unnamed protein product [Polarella glacialis]
MAWDYFQSVFEQGSFEDLAYCSMSPGQLVFLAQRVDRPRAQQYGGDQVLMRKALEAKRFINHPDARPAVQKAARTIVKMVSSQLPIGPASVGTFNNFQGKSAKDEIGVPTGHTYDLKLLQSTEEDWAHYYMILGRATSLSASLFMNFPKDDDGEYDFSIFENGPKQLKIFPAFSDVPALLTQDNGEYGYLSDVWDLKAGLHAKRNNEVLTENMPLRARMLEREQRQEPSKRRPRADDVPSLSVSSVLPVVISLPTASSEDADTKADICNPSALKVSDGLGVTGAARAKTLSTSSSSSSSASSAAVILNL